MSLPFPSSVISPVSFFLLSLSRRWEFGSLEAPDWVPASQHGLFYVPHSPSPGLILPSLSFTPFSPGTQAQQPACSNLLSAWRSMGEMMEKHFARALVFWKPLFFLSRGWDGLTKRPLFFLNVGEWPLQKTVKMYRREAHGGQIRRNQNRRRYSAFQKRARCILSTFSRGDSSRLSFKTH